LDSIAVRIPTTFTYTGTPESLTVNGTAQPLSSDNAFHFAEDFALEPESTHFAFDILYHFTTQPTGREFDSTTHVDFNVLRSDTGPYSSEVSMLCVDLTTVLLPVDRSPAKIPGLGSALRPEHYLLNGRRIQGPTAELLSAIGILRKHGSTPRVMVRIFRPW
jgi:hypothetical protein